MSEYKNQIRTAAYEVSKDMRSQERQYKEEKKLRKKEQSRKKSVYAPKGHNRKSASWVYFEEE